LGPVAAGRTDSRRFESKIVSATVTDGKAVVSSAVKDKKPDNNTTAIKVTVLTGSGGTGGGSGLPITGANVGLIGGLGLGAIAIGAVLLVLTRRRREVVVPPTD
jgi:LPXTG-motif cell wall-anchored protein